MHYTASAELSKLGDDVLGSSAPPASAAPVLCSIDMPVDTIAEAALSPETAGSLLSVQSAPPEQSDRVEHRERPVSLLLELPLASQVGAYLSAMSPTEQEEDSLLTLSSVTARPLLAVSRKLRPQSDSSECSPPDGGYGWVVVFGAFMVQFWVAGLFKSYGVLYVEIMETFPDSSESAACSAPRDWPSPSTAPSSCICCIGGGLSTTPGIVIVSQYFDKHRALANGICVSGTAAGSFVFPMLIEKLVTTYGLHGTLLLLGGGMLHVCVAATLYRPPPVALPTDTPATTTTENTTLLNDIQEGKTGLLNDNKLQNLFQQDSDMMTFNHKST
ncbi:unnamed protein product [Leptidea sinapis]|uniref:Major facilitator superfamily (MFS) profile domain-containing protein n=1 Tax=Leptidea sinapis TaxID=189913 RepID=A0A5E4QY09_9NEOP|nr:unnamed protein product [Leptidea sinapis]